MSNLVKDIDYRFTMDETAQNRSLIEIMTGKYKGVKFYFGSIKLPDLVESEDLTQDDEIMVRFNYEIEDHAGFEASLIEDDSEFHQVLGEIMDNLLTEAVQLYED